MSEQPKTQRAMANYNSATNICIATYHPKLSGTQRGLTPVLVVPEVAVRKCQHDDMAHWTMGYKAKWCPNCGAMKDGEGRWQRPRILRAEEPK
jgi:hypothetical protein